MNRGFWDSLPRPFFVLAPMYDVTDTAFRQIITQCGKPDVFFTEFVSTDGLMSAGRERLMHHLKFSDNERPIVAQIFGANPEKFYDAAKLITELGFDGIDINMGCPKKNEIRGGACAALFKNPKLAQEIILATKEGTRDAAQGHHSRHIDDSLSHRERGRGEGATHADNHGLPVSIKIRIGDNKIDWQPWIAALLEAQPAAISIHLRTRKEMSKVPAHWEEMPKIVEFINEQCTKMSLRGADLSAAALAEVDALGGDEAIPIKHTEIASSVEDSLLAMTGDYRPLIVGNGDVQDLNDAKNKARETGCDGVMIGRAIFQNPWLFADSPQSQDPLSLRERGRGEGSTSFINSTSNINERLRLLLHHAHLFDQNFKNIKSFEVFKRFIKIYVTGFDGAAELREKLYQTHSAEEIPNELDKFIGL